MNITLKIKIKIRYLLRKSGIIFFLKKIPIRRLNIEEPENHILDVKKEKIRVNRGEEWNSVFKYDLTIVVPVYNVEKYIRECVKSLLNQKTRFSYQIIIVDDGSKDSSIEKISDLLGDNKIKLLKKENGGLSSARNAAINVVSSGYITFVDSDDYLDEKYIEETMLEITNKDLDIVICNYTIVNDNGEIIEKSSCEQSNKYDVPGYAWGKVYKTELFKNIEFPMGLWFEDTIVVGLIIAGTDNIGFVNKELYRYRLNICGITSTSIKNPKSFDTYEAMFDVLDTMKESKSIDFQEYLRYILKLVILNYNRTVYLNKKTRKYYFFRTKLKITDFFSYDELSAYINAKRENYHLLESLVNSNYKWFKAYCYLV